jgi:hypothetical protein
MRVPSETVEFNIQAFGTRKKAIPQYSVASVASVVSGEHRFFADRHAAQEQPLARGGE